MVVAVRPLFSWCLYVGWACSACHTVHDRDTNSGLNIRATGLNWLEEKFSAADSRLAVPVAVVNKAFMYWHLAGMKAAPGHGRPVGGLSFQAL